ncbi:MAG: amylo-alpha-1,6-glucosidase [Ornithinibacter sp.]
MTSDPAEAHPTRRTTPEDRGPDPVAFDIREVPFSRRGCWLNLSPVVAPHRTSDLVHLVSHRNGFHAVLALAPERAGSRVDASWLAGASTFSWAAPHGTVDAAFDGAGALHLRGSGLGLRLTDAAARLTPFTGTYLFTDPVDGAHVFTSYETGRRYEVTVRRGVAEVDGAEALGEAARSVLLGADGGPWEAVVSETTSNGPAATEEVQPFDEVVESACADFIDYLDVVAPWRTHATPAAGLAAYVMWSATVRADGFLRRESVLMSKHWMDKVWSWDHCFNALALAPGSLDAALDQLLGPFDHQDANGALPDSISHSELLYNYVKPPIHGWALRRLRATAERPLTRAELAKVFDGLSRWTTFWTEHRRRPGHAIPYYQHGNDSGWDNSTTFDVDRVVESPDLAAFLVLQLEVLADLADELDRPSAAWRTQREELLAALLDELWTGSHFVARGALSGRVSTSSSLLTLMPLVLGKRLPAPVLEALADGIRAHLTEHGLATEPTGSQHYEDDGYWRGPIWAPSTALIEDGLRTGGFTDLADAVSARFRALCERSGFAENFDARTGAGLRDRAYTWTAAVYLILAADHARRTQ